MVMIKILIVEDNKIAAIQAKNMFNQKFTAEIKMASCGEDALAMFKEDTFDIIMMDIGLGDGIDGIETTKRMRDIEAELNHQRCPIYALTAHSSNSEELEHHKKMGIDKTYNKPARQEILDEILENLPDSLKDKL